MRELRFRAWVYYGEKLEKPHYSRDYDSISRFFEDHDENDIDQCIEQYTGFKDKNGKEIYEGDIVSTSSVGTWQIEERRGCFWVGKYALYGQNDYCEVIGNIHDNHELLEDQQ